MAGDKKVIYLDACIFISMITGEQRPNDESAHVAGLASMIDAKEIIPVTSTLTRVEVLECTLTDQQIEIMKKVLSPPKTQIKEPSAMVMDVAHEIRDYYQQLKTTGASDLPTVETPDAIHLATAIVFQCDSMFTFDEKDKRGGRPKRGMIPLSGNVAGRYPLVITKPFVRQLGLEL